MLHLMLDLGTKSNTKRFSHKEVEEVHQFPRLLTQES